MAKKPKFATGTKSVPFWFYVIGPFDTILPRGLFTSRSVPETVSDVKEITYVDTAIPGGGSAVIAYGGMGARNLSLALKLVDKNDKFGVTAQLNIFELLKNPDWASGGFSPVSPKSSFVPNCKIFMSYGTIFTIPQIFRVKKCDYVTSYPNQMGRPQVCDVTLDLILDETTAIYTAERIWSMAFGIIGSVKSLKKTFGKGHPYMGGF